MAVAIVGLATPSAATADSPNSCADAKKIKIKHCSPLVLWDTMPLGGIDTGGWSGTARPVNGTLMDNDAAAGFLTGTENVLLGSVQLPLGFISGVNQADFYLVGDRVRDPSGCGQFYCGEPMAPDDSVVLEHWPVDNIPTEATIIELESVAPRELSILAVHQRACPALRHSLVYPGIPDDWFCVRRAQLALRTKRRLPELADVQLLRSWPGSTGNSVALSQPKPSRGRSVA
jgi:hypothetical protein